MSKMFQCAAIAVLALSITNCGANEEDRVKSWETAQKRAVELKASYPNFAALIDAQNAAAKTAWEAANKETDKEKKVEAMGAATKQLTSLTGRLAEVDSKSDSIRSDLKRMNELKILAKDVGKRRDINNDAQVVLSNVHSAVIGATPANMEEASALLTAQIGDLISMQSRVSSAITSMKPKSAKKPAKKKK